VGIRADSPADIAAIRAAVSVPIIGIYKFDIPGFQIRITPTVEHAIQIADAGADAIALDATRRPRPNGLSVADMVAQVKAQTGKLVFGDVSTFEEGPHAAEVGADAILPTLAGTRSTAANYQDPILS